MPVKLNNFTYKFQDFIKKRKNLSAIFIIGIVGIILIGISDTSLLRGKENDYDKCGKMTNLEYVEQLESKTKKMIESINGAGKCRVMITIESSSENQFAYNERNSHDNQNSQDDIRNNGENQKEIVMKDSLKGGKEALVEKVIEPKIKGALVLCRGADKPEINEKVTLAVKTILGISANNIYVDKIKE